jgi:IS30 family transposase
MTRIPKNLLKKAIKQLSSYQQNIKQVEDILNNKPRKKLNFLTPNEFLLRNLSN